MQYLTSMLISILQHPFKAAFGILLVGAAMALVIFMTRYALFTELGAL